jgi:hypothetical protein
VKLMNDSSYKIDSEVHWWILASIALCGWILSISPSLLLNILPSCLLKLTFNLNCPFCGMTRDFVSLANGNLEMLNPLSIPIFLCVFFVYPIAIAFYSINNKKLFLNYSTIYRSTALAILMMFILNNLG